MKSQIILLDVILFLFAFLIFFQLVRIVGMEISSEKKILENAKRRFYLETMLSSIRKTWEEQDYLSNPGKIENLVNESEYCVNISLYERNILLYSFQNCKVKKPIVSKRLVWRKNTYYVLVGMIDAA